jgi:hypothetical protein
MNGVRVFFDGSLLESARTSLVNRVRIFYAGRCLSDARMRRFLRPKGAFCPLTRPVIRGFCAATIADATVSKSKN